MATSGKHDDSETETTIDVSGFMRAFTHDDEENADTSTDRPGDLSMFCKACLHPYCGEQKAGTIVLRCERCGQTDTVLEERVGSLNPQEWIGNLMMNRFMQVVKEQEDLSANLSDPLFADDEYQRISLSLSEYTLTIEKIAVRMYDIAKKARLATEEDRARIEACQEIDSPVAGLEEVQAMNATKTLIEIHKTLVMNDPVTKSDEEKRIKDEDAVCAGSVSLKDQESVHSDGNQIVNGKDESENIKYSQDLSGNESQAKSEVMDIDQEKRQALLELTRERLDQLGSTMLSLIETLIEKYNLPNDILAKVEERLRNADKTENDENSEADSETEPDLDTQDATDIPVGSENDQEFENIKNEDEDENDVNENNTESNIESEESDTIFNIPTEEIRKEVFETLGNKLKLSFDNGANVVRKIKLEQTEASVDFQNTEDDTENNENGDMKRETSQERAENNTKDNGRQTENTEEGSASYGENGSVNDDNENESESCMVNFYSLSSEFIRELQRRKSKALGERKDKALAKIHEKIQSLKKEMERVEEVVTAELTLAYKRKMKKVETQRKQLDEKHEQVKEAERLLEYYTMTGQDDKVAELIEKFNIQYEN